MLDIYPLSLYNISIKNRGSVDTPKQTIFRTFGKKGKRDKDMTGSWSEEKKSVTLTNGQWNKLYCYLTMTTQYRLKTLEVYSDLAKECSEDGTLKFPTANENLFYWQEMNDFIEMVKCEIDK